MCKTKRIIAVLLAGLSVLVGLVMLGGGQPAYGQDNGYAEWLREQRQEYAAFHNKQDAAFASFLAASWRDVKVRSARLSPLDDKPETVPSAAGRQEPTPATDPADSNAPQQPSGESAPRPPAPDAPAAPSASSSNAPPSVDTPSGVQESRAQEEAAAVSALPQRSTATFFGTPVSVAYADALTPGVDGSPRPAMVRRFWEAFAQGPVSPFIERLSENRKRLSLDDWGYYRYLTTLSASLYPSGTAPSQNARALWVWAVLVKSGYAARVGYNDEEVFLMLPSDDRLYDVPQLRIDGQRYYLLGARGRKQLGSLRTYDGQHPEAKGTMQFDLSEVPALASSSGSRTVSFFYDGTEHTIPLRYDRALLDYLEDYPKAELRILFQSGMSAGAHQALMEALRPLVEGRTEADAVNMLLRFVQTAFAYKVDAENFGEERFLFPEETLQQPFSDCEDRSVLFSYLVRHVLGLKTVALGYPSHVATGVRLETTPPEDLSGTRVEVEGDTYVMADPTYIGATIGMAMPFVVGETPEIISIQ